MMTEQNTGDRKKICIIEDEPAMIELVSLILRNRGYDVVGALGGQEGLELIASTNPDLVLLDLMMPDMSGWDVYQQMKADDAMKAIPVVIVTAKAQSIDKVLGLHIAKVQDYITKPFSPNELVESVKRVLDQQMNAQPSSSANATSTTDQV
jgi:two-component system, OmpR family, response regulator VicR